MSTFADISDISSSLGEPKWLFDMREKSLVYGEELPSGEKYGIAINALESEKNPEFAMSVDYEVTPSKGVEIYTWKEAVAQEEISMILERLLTSPLFLKAHSAVSALARALFRTGLVVYAQPTLDEKGNSLKETLIIQTTIPEGESADILVVIAKTGSRLDVKQVFSGGGKRACFARTVVVLSEEDAQVDFESASKELKGFISLDAQIFVSSHASLKWTEDAQVDGQYRSQVRSLLVGESSHCEIFHTVLSSSSSVYDICVEVEHCASHSYSRIIAVGLADDSSRIVYRGTIKMKKNVAHTEGVQEGKFLVSSSTASVDAIPAQDVASKDVHSLHKLSVSHIRKQDLFYANTRGFSEKDAHELAVESFFGTLLQKAGKIELLDRIRERITGVRK